MRLTMVHARGVTLCEGPPGVPLVGGDGDATRLLEQCFSCGTRALMLHAENLPPAFFDLSSGVAGAVLQKLRNYGVRLAIVLPPGGVAASSRFGEMVAEEARGREFAIFDSREAAHAWLAGA